MTIQAVLFDIGGVLVTTPPEDWADRFAERLEMSIADFEARTEDIWRDGSLGRASLAEVHARLAAALDTPLSIVDSAMSAMWIQYLGRANREMIEFARSLRPRYRTGILSNSFIGARERERGAYGFEDLVDELVYSHEVGWAKPDPEVYTIAVRRLGAQPSEIMFIDDRPLCVEAARACGLNAVLFAENARTIRAVHEVLDPASG
jgi:putative hydrolase of the HAD superfamily